MLVKLKSFYSLLSSRINPFKFIVLVYLVIVCQILPWRELLNTVPSTGGDVGSHFYALHAILKSWSLRPWNPGHLGGEPILVHYFPLPFMIMALFSLVLPAGFCFNWFYILPVLALPFCVFYFMKKCRAPGLSCEFAFLLSIIFIFNTSYAAWGGNIFSTLAGQFAHAYALCFLFILMAVMMDEVKKSSPISIKAALLVSAIILSHAYIALCLPLVASVVVLLDEEIKPKKILTVIFWSGLLGVLLSLWWLIPSLSNAGWTTPYASSWLERLPSSSYFPNNFKIITGISTLALLISLIIPKLRHHLKSAHLKFIFAFLSIAAFYFFLVKIFPLIGLVDIRAIPQVHLFLLLAMSCILANALSLLKQFWMTLLIFLSIFGCYYLLLDEIEDVHKRMEWNWSGWESKIGYYNLLRLSEMIKGDFSSPRVAFEHSSLNHKAGTMRSLEMIPYFSGRSVTESLYMQSTAFAPSAFYFQSLLGPQRSCPFPNFPCGVPNLKRAAELMPLLGIQDLIIASPYTHNQVKKLSSLFELKPRLDPWSVATLKQKVSLVEVMKTRPLPMQEEDWKQAGINYVINYKVYNPWLYVPSWTPIETQFEFSKLSYSPRSECHPELKVEWSHIKLSTNCPGVPHVIKFSFHPSFSTSSNDQLYLVLPSYIGITPSRKEVDIVFGQSLLWKISNLISILAFGFIIIIKFKNPFCYKVNVK